MNCFIPLCRDPLDHPPLKVSSIKTSARVTFHNASGAPIGTFAKLVTLWPAMFPGVALANRAMESIMGADFVSQGQTLDIRGWQFKLSILGDPNGLRRTEWPWVSFGLRADPMIPAVEPPLHLIPIPEASLLLQGGIGPVGFAMWKRKVNRGMQRKSVIDLG
jgi:hypothetical protein